ncbi:MAG TPA: hypothetical protein VK203_01275 [Nostocaceae cyanobacterium]|nr:hypothetical protein [Nostocaceae cyanobacterium]
MRYSDKACKAYKSRVQVYLTLIESAVIAQLRVLGIEPDLD